MSENKPTVKTEAELAAERFETNLQANIDRALESGSEEMKGFIRFLQDYVVKMSPKQPMTSTEGIEYQTGLLRVMVRLINKSTPEAFRKDWSLVLSLFWKYNSDVLGYRYVNRFPEMWNNTADLDLFQKLNNLCMVTADPSKRGNAKLLVNIAKTVEKGLTPDGKKNILTFYHA